MLHYEKIPAAAKNGRHLMVILHGLGDSLEGYRWLPAALNLPWLSYALVNAPDSYFGGYSWYDLPGDSHPGIVRSRKQLFELLDCLHETECPSASTYLFGFSQGCLMAWEIGIRYPRRLAACIGISGYAHQADKLLAEASPVAGEQHFLITHGRRDPLIPIDPVRADIEKFRQNSIQIEWREFQKEHTIAGLEEVETIRRFVQQHRRQAGAV